MTKPKVTIAFLGNLNYDSRCLNLFDSFKGKGFEVQFIGFDWQTQNFSSVKQKNISIFKLSKRFSLLFYVQFALILTYRLFQSNSKIFFAEDIYTLPFTVFVSYFKKSKVIYDSRELYGHLAGLVNRKIIQSIIQKLELVLIRKVDWILATGELDRQYLVKEYKIENVSVLRNLPRKISNLRKIDLHSLIGIEKKYRILLYQGVVVHGRGLGVLINLMKKLDDYALLIIGEGEHFSYYKTIVENENLCHKVFFVGKVNNAELLNYTCGANIGTALIENLSLSYNYALPNKLFEYIMCGVPVLVSKLPQMEKIVTDYNVGKIVDISKPEEIVKAIIEMTNSDLYNQLFQNCVQASMELNWENEFMIVEKVLNNLY